MVKAISALAGMGLVVGLLLSGVGCTASRTGEETLALHGVQSNTYNVPPKQLHQLARQAVASEPLGMAIEGDQKGVIVTGYKEGYRGDWHIARYWQERTRFRIVVIPDWEDPAGHSRLEVSEETQVRSNSQASWQDDLGVQRPERAAEVIRLISEKIPATASR